MKAVVFRGFGHDLEVTDVELAPPGPGEVLVRIAAAGVCHSDLHVIRGEWTRMLPTVLGHEGSGTIVELGPDVTGLAPGDHVVLSWVAPCGVCRHCRAGVEARCELASTVVGPLGGLNDGTSRLSVNGEKAYHYLGVSSFAEYAVVPASGAAWPMQGSADAVDLDTAASDAADSGCVQSGCAAARGDNVGNGLKFVPIFPAARGFDGPSGNPAVRTLR